MALSVGAVLATIALTGLAVAAIGAKLGVWLPLSLGAGFALLAYAEHGWARFRSTEAFATPHAARQLRSLLLVGLSLMALFWTVSLYAVQTGKQRALGLAQKLASDPQVVIYAKQRLMLAGPGVQVDDIRLADSKYRYLYSGLRLLIRSQDRYVLLPKHWARRRGSAYVLRDGDDIRLEFTVCC